MSTTGDLDALAHSGPMVKDMSVVTAKLPSEACNAHHSKNGRRHMGAKGKALKYATRPAKESWTLAACYGESLENVHW